MISTVFALGANSAGFVTRAMHALIPILNNFDITEHDDQALCGLLVIDKNTYLAYFKFKARACLTEELVDKRLASHGLPVRLRAKF